ncbi:MAG: hypothetical protein JEZ09_05785 [Salinivirgaceae bacterium]|nr:hypothetical protein [Salinivirgaceae bacterium]
MNRNNLIKIINKELTILTDLVDGFTNVADIHPFEIDLALSKVKDIYGELLLLKDDSVEINIDLKNPNAFLADKTRVTLNAPVPTKKEVREEEPLPNEDDRIKEEESVAHKSEFVDEERGVFKENESNQIADELAEPVEVTDKEILSVPEDNQTQEVSVSSDAKESVDLVTEEDSQKIELEKIPEDTEPAKQEELILEAKALVEEELPQESEMNIASDKKLNESNSEIVADKFQKQMPSLNDMLAGIKSRKDLASSIKDKPIENLKKEIKINDRIWYVNELFNKNNSLYESTINELNNASNLDAALSYLFKNFNWDQNKKSTISFLELIFRRFADN